MNSILISISLIVILFTYCVESNFIDHEMKLSNKRGIFGDRCLKDGSCGPTQYCDHDFPNPFGKCKEGLVDGSACIRDSRCASKKCSFFFCASRNRVVNGTCQINADCLSYQYCGSNKKRSGSICKDRKCMGFCSKNKHCMSNNCHLLTCMKSQDKERCP
jgi:hypothetical protein